MAVVAPPLAMKKDSRQFTAVFDDVKSLRTRSYEGRNLLFEWGNVPHNAPNKIY